MLMKKTIIKIKKLYFLCPVRHLILLISAAVICLHLSLRHNQPLMIKLSDCIVRPVHRFLSVLNSHIPFSVAELLIGVFCAAVLVFLAVQTVRLIAHKNKLVRLYKLLITIATCFCCIYAGFSLLWGIYYYGDDFLASSGLSNDPIAVNELESVTRYFADMANEYCTQVQRDEGASCCADRNGILSLSPQVYKSLEQAYPCLQGKDIAAKGIHFSRIMSYTDFTGFFFPFTAEANVNTDSPVAFFPVTVAHELSHQRGVAKEQEANFVAVLACLSYGNTDYVYSASLLAYTYLGNALYSADYDAWKEIYLSLDPLVIKDFMEDSAYWDQFETPVESVSNAVYDGFLKSYDQELGLKSYGACVDMLVNYYYPLCEKNQ